MDASKLWGMAGNSAEIYQACFGPAVLAPWASSALALVDLRPGARLLDVACGTGVVTRQADRSRPVITTCILGPLGALGGKLLTDMGSSDVKILAGSEERQQFERTVERSFIIARTARQAIVIQTQFAEGMRFGISLCREEGYPHAIR
jgi:hypothetical protein